MDGIFINCIKNDNHNNTNKIMSIACVFNVLPMNLYINASNRSCMNLCTPVLLLVINYFVFATNDVHVWEKRNIPRLVNSN